MKSLLYFFVIFVLSFGAYAQTTAYPQYDQNGMPVKESKKQSVKSETTPKKGVVARRSKSGLLINKGTYKKKPGKIELDTLDRSGLLKPAGQVSKKPNGDIELMHYDRSGLLKYDRGNK